MATEYRVARDRILKQEVELRRQTEAVAASRWALPRGVAVPENYIFDAHGPDGAPTDVTLSELFDPGNDTLFLNSMMFPRAPEEDLPCASCTQFLDSFDRVTGHAGKRFNVAIVVKTALPRVAGRFLSSVNNTTNLDYRGETDDGSKQPPMLNSLRASRAGPRSPAR